AAEEHVVRLGYGAPRLVLVDLAQLELLEQLARHVWPPGAGRDGSAGGNAGGVQLRDHSGARAPPPEQPLELLARGLVELTARRAAPVFHEQAAQPAVGRIPRGAL